MANNEITGPGQAAQVTVVGGGQQYRPSVNYSMPVMQPRQRFQMPDIDVGSSINIDLSPIADAMIKSSELKAKKAEKESEDALANIYNSYARDVNEISGEFEQGYASMEQAQARFRKLNDNVLRVPGIDASKIATLGSKLNGYSEDLMKTQATERIKDKQDFLYKRIEEYQKMPQFSGYSFDEIEAMIVHDNLQNVMLTNINEQLKTVTTPEEKRALESQKIALMTGNAESMALLKLQDIVKNYDGAELNEQTYQSIQAELTGFLSQQFDFQRASQIAYSAMKKFHMGNLHTMKRMSVESRDKVAKEIETVTKNKLTAAEGELIDNLPQATLLSIAKASLAKKTLPDAVFNFQNSLELQGFMKDIMSIGKNTEGQLVMPAKGSLGGISTATINTMSRILQDPSTEKYTIGPTAIYLGNLSGAVRDKVVENISKDPEGTVATAKEYTELFGKKIPVVKARLEKESKESEQNLIWDFSNRQQYMDDLETCNKEINACRYAAKGGAKEYSKRTASADLLKGVLSTNALRYDERTGTIGMVDISDYVLPPLKDEASFKDWLARNVLERGAKWMMELGQVFTGNEVQENVDSLNDWLRTVPPEYRHGAINVIFNQEIPVAGPGEKIKSTGNWASSTMEFIAGLTKSAVSDRTLLDGYTDITNKTGAFVNNAIKEGYGAVDKFLSNQRVEQQVRQQEAKERNEQAGKDLIEGISTANERSKVFLEGVGDVAGELFGFRDAYGSEIENAPESVDVITAPKTEFEKYVNKKRELEKLRKDMGAMGLTKEVAETDKLLADLKHPDSDIVPGINGNISIRDREAIDLGNGEHGTELSITVEADGKHFVIPTIYKDKDGVTRQHTDEEAKEHFRSYGEFLHVEDDPKRAELMAFRIHDRERGGDVLKPYPEKFKPAIVVASNAAGIDIEDIRGKTFAETSDGKQFADSENVGWFQVGDAAAKDVMKDTKYVKKVKKVYPEFKGDKNNPIDNIFLGVGYMKKQEEEARRLFKKYNVPEDTLLEYAFVRYTANQKKLDGLLEKYGEDWIKDEHLISITKNKDNRYVNYIKNYRKAKEAALKGEIVKR